MAAYAALVSVMNIMDNIQKHPRLSTSLDEKQAESLAEKLDFLLDFVESYNSPHGRMIIKKEIEDLEARIASAAHAAEDVIESHVVDRILAGSAGDHGEAGSSFLLDLQRIIDDMDSINIEVEVMMFKKQMGFKDQQQPTYSTPAASSRPLPTGKTSMVGFDDELIQLMDMLTGQEPRRQIISIVGMGGIGKTTLARNVYENSLVAQHFDVRAWVTVSQECNVREILLGILSCLRESTGEMDEKSEYELGERLYKILSGRRYLIILDDMWSIELWDRIKFFFPDNFNKSRIIVTTRLFNLASCLGSSELTLKFLDDDKSWDLFCEKAFAQEDCPLELVSIGKKIVKMCKGIPLSISVIGGLLAKSSRTQEYWEYVAEVVSSIPYDVEDYEYMHILSLGYSHLPACLKPCFLYMGILAEDCEIHVSRIIKLWVAEGFLKPNKDQSLEDIGEGYIKDLVDRNLILASSLGSNGKFKTLKIHDLLSDLCLRVAEREKFLCVTRSLYTPRYINRERRIIIHGNTEEKYYDPQVLHALESTSLARSLISKSPTLLFSKSKLLRVLIEVYSNPLDLTFQQVNLRFLAHESIGAPIGWIPTYKLPSSISLQWNVQTLIITGRIGIVVAPSEIWDMPQLRHLDFYRIRLPEPPLRDKQDDLVLRNLQTLGTVLDFVCSEEVCKRMPNIKKLRICYGDFSGKSETGSRYCLYNVGRFSKLESLSYCFRVVPNRDDLLKNLRFPSSLKKLTLQDCELHWDDLTIIGLLPYLEVLKLKCQSVRGPEWDLVEGEFLRLKFLEIDSCYLIYWNADSSHFPVLENLVLCRLYRLEEIPSGIGDIATLKDICLVECSVSSAISAMRILEEQASLGNEDLQVRIKFGDAMELEEFMETVELEGLSSHNCQIGVV